MSNRPDMQTMKMIKPSINVNYSIESCDGFKWETEYVFTRLSELEEELERMKKSRPNVKLRVIRSEWQVFSEY